MTMGNKNLLFIYTDEQAPDTLAAYGNRMNENSPQQAAGYLTLSPIGP